MTSYKKLNKNLIEAGEKLQNAVGPLNVKVNRVEYVDGYFVADMTHKDEGFFLSHPLPDLATFDTILPQIRDAVLQFTTPKPLLVN